MKMFTRRNAGMLPYSVECVDITSLYDQLWKHCCRDDMVTLKRPPEIPHKRAYTVDVIMSAYLMSYNKSELA